MKQLQLQVPDFHLKGWALLGHAFTLFFKNTVPILFIVALIAIPVETIKNYYFVDWYENTGFFSTQRMDGITGLLILCVITPIVVNYLLSQMTQANVGISLSLVWGLRKWTRLIMYGFLQNVIVFAGLLLFIVPGVLFAVRLMLMPIVVSVEHTSSINPMEVCRKMARGRFFKFAGYALVGYAALAAFGVIVGFVAFSMPVDSWIAATVLDVLLDWFSQLITIILLLVYLQTRTESKEAQIKEAA